MKSFISAMLIFVLIIVGTGYYSRRLDDAIDVLGAHAAALESHAAASDWAACRSALDTLLSDWHSVQKWLKAMVNHNDIDQIQQTVYEIKGYTLTENREAVLVKLGVLQILLEHIPGNEELSLINIL